MVKINYYNISTIEIDFFFLFHVSIIANLDFLFFMHLFLLHYFLKNKNIVFFAIIFSMASKSKFKV